MNPKPLADTQNATDRDERINSVVSEYESAVDRGELPDFKDWVAAHPELAPELASYFEGLQSLGLIKMKAGVDLDATHDYQAGLEPNPEISTQAVARLGDYILLERLGRGGEGTVYRARHRINDHEVALKMVSAAQGTDLDADSRIRDEARAIAGLRHPNIVRIHFSGEDQGIWYYTMELMEGGGLNAHLDEFKNHPRDAAELVVQIARGIHHAHSRGILHLDLKPANVLLDADGLPHVSDFGLAKRLRVIEEAELPASSCVQPQPIPDGRVLNMSIPQVRGTAPYMSPEMAAGNLASVSTSADIYGLGAILYSMLAGRPPTVGDSMEDTLFRVVHESPRPPREFNKAVDRELQGVCLKCLRKDPAQRYGSADALANDLARFLRGEPTLAGEPTARKRAWFWFRRHPLGTAAACLTFLIFWLAGVVGSLGELREGNRREAAQVAREASIQIEMVKRTVSILSKEPGFRESLAEWPDGSPQQLASLNQVLLKANAECNSWFGITGGNPLVNMFVLNNEGVLLADTFPNSRSVGLTFSLRDYFRHFHEQMTSAAPKNAVYVSRSFRSVKDSLYKIAVSTRIWDGDRVLGVIVANVTVGRSLLLLNMTEELPGIFVAAPVDWTYSFRGRGTPALADRSPYIAVLHRDYQDPKQPLIPLKIKDYPRLPDFEDDSRLVEATEFDRNGSIIHYRRVGETPLVVIATHRYPWPVRPFFDADDRPWAVFVTGATLAALIVLLVQRRTHVKSALSPSPLHQSA